MELTLEQVKNLLILSTEALITYKNHVEDILDRCECECECQCKAMPVKELDMSPEGVFARIQAKAPKAMSFGFDDTEDQNPTEPEPTEPTEAPKIAPQSEEKPAVDKLPEAPKEVQEKPIFRIKPTAEIGSGGKGGHTSYPAEEDPKPLQPSDLLEPEPSEVGKNKKKLDDGKICALRRAGWNWDKIADEMHCSAQTALNHYNAYIRKLGKE